MSARQYIWDEPIDINGRRGTRAASNASTNSSMLSNKSSVTSSSPSNDDSWSPASSLNNHDRRDDELIYVLVPITNPPSEFGPVDDLPRRPSRRSFLRRLSSRFERDHSEWRGLKMPRNEYNRFFRRDASWRYVGTEPERQWTEEDLRTVFGCYQDSAQQSWERRESNQWV